MDERTVKRLLSKINQHGPVPEYNPALGPCWLWKGKPGSRGYGYFWYDQKSRLAHRFVYEFFVGPIPEGLVIDHLCRVQMCVNPHGHLEPVTDRVNIERGTAPAARNMIATECFLGHPLDEENTYYDTRGDRGCRTCQKRRNREWAEKNRPPKGGKGSHQTVKTHCPSGHEYSPENTYRSPGGGRACRACTRIRNRENQRARRAKAREQTG
jgi:hypothetical protein